VATDYRRHSGFLKGLGVDVDTSIADFAEVPDTGSYGAGAYTIACQEPGQAAQDGSRTAVENCLNKNKSINVIYAINEPRRSAPDAVKASGRTDIMIVTIDGGCAAVVDQVGQRHHGHFTAVPHEDGLARHGAIAKIARGGEKPSTTPGLDFFDTGVELVTDKPIDGVESISTSDAATVLGHLTHLMTRVRAHTSNGQPRRGHSPNRRSGCAANERDTIEVTP
jgi:fructose transport system substrate-binding protein